MRSTRFGLKLATCLAIGMLASTTGCKWGGWGGGWKSSSLAWNPMKSWGWGSSTPPAASSLASTTKPSTQIPTPGPTSSVATKTPSTSPAASAWASYNNGAPAPVNTNTTPGYGGTTAPGTAVASYPATAHANSYPTQPATAYGVPGQPGQVAPTAGYNAGPYNMTATPAGGAATGGYAPTYTAAQPSPYTQPAAPQQGPYPTGGYQNPAPQNYTQPQPTYQPVDPNAGYNTGTYSMPYNAPPAQPNYQQPGYAPPVNNGPNTSGYIQGGYNTGASNMPAPTWQSPDAAAPGGDMAAAQPYDAAPAAATAPATGSPSGEFAQAYTTPAPEAAPASSGGMEVSSVTTGTPAGSPLPASLTSTGGYRPGSTGRPLDTGVQNAMYETGTGYSSGGTIYR